MLVLLTIGLPLFAASGLLGLHVLRPKFKYIWLVAAITALLTWTLVLVLRLQIPLTIPLVTWKPIELFPVSPSLQLDDISWSYAFSLVTLLLGVTLTAVARIPKSEDLVPNEFSSDWLTWSSSLLLISLGVLATIAGNLITLLLAWAAIDILELSIRIGITKEGEQYDRIVFAFGARVIGILLVIWAIAAARASGYSINLISLDPGISVFLILAAVFRLGVIPIHMPSLKRGVDRRGFGTLLRFAPAISGLMLLSRTASQAIPTQMTLILLISAGLVALYGSIFWSMATDELEGRPYWIIAVAALTAASAIQSQAAASVAWGVALILSGGILFLYSSRDRRLIILPILGLLGISGLPFTAVWPGMSIYTSTLPVYLWIVFIITQALILSAYAVHIIRPANTMTGVVRFVWVIYPWGLALLPLVQYLIVILNQTLTPSIGSGLPEILATWPSLVASIFAALIIIWRIRGPHIGLPFSDKIKPLLSFNWIYGILGQIYRLIGRTVAFIEMLVEGKGAVLWTILLLTLLISLLSIIELGE